MNPRYVRLRAERYELGKGRIYTVTITATDAAGNTSKQTIEITVPLSAATSREFKEAGRFAGKGLI
jgi:PKD repeat protein